MSPRRRISSRGAKQKLAWTPTVAAVRATIAAGGEAVLDIAGATNGNIPPGASGSYTIRRWLGSYYVEYSNSSSDLLGAFGLIVMGRDAFDAAGFQDHSSDFAPWAFIHQFFQGEGPSGAADEWRRYDFDVKTNRRVRASNDTPAMVFKNDSAVSLNFIFDIRLLIGW